MNPWSFVLLLFLAIVSSIALMLLYFLIVCSIFGMLCNDNVFLGMPFWFVA